MSDLAAGHWRGYKPVTASCQLMPAEAAGLHVAHTAAYLSVPRVARGLPESRRNLVLVPDQGGDAVAALPAQVLLAGAHEGQTDTAAAVLAEHCEPVHVPPPAIPRSYQHAHEPVTDIGNKQAPGRLAEQSVDILDPVGGGCVRAARPLPQVEDRRRLSGSRGAYGVLLLAQADTVANVLLGSVAEAVAAHSRRPVLIVHRRG